MKKNFWFFFVLIILFIGIQFFVYLFLSNFYFNDKDLLKKGEKEKNNTKIQEEFISKKEEYTEIVGFKNAEEFQDYILESKNNKDYAFGSVGSMDTPASFEAESSGAMSDGFSAGKSITREGSGLSLPQSASPERISKTNVQVKDIDEPDIIKTNGESIFYSLNSPVIRELTDIQNDERVAVYNNKGSVFIFNAFPPENLNFLKKIENSGEMFLKDDILVLIGETDYPSSGKSFSAYNVSDPQNPIEKWNFKLERNNYFETARLIEDEVIIITRKEIGINEPCPIRVFEGKEEFVSCENVYHPRDPIYTDITYNIFKIDLESGELKDNISFTASQNNTVVYMSKNSIYLSYALPQNFSGVITQFVNQAQDMLPENVIVRINEISSYNISEGSKIKEITNILESFIYFMDGDEGLRVENEFENRMNDFMEQKKREIYKSGIMKVNVENFVIEGAAIIPGELLNQFSMDEYDGNLRVATTVGERWGNVESVNDLYVLNSDMKIIGEALDMGRDERVYSVRFVGEVGYIVTFRETDPFYALDLSDPKDPIIKGELKIPGYSSYLHSLGERLIVGIGKESSNVKISLFDVSNLENPKEVSKYELNEYSSEVLYNHHAFLVDEKHQIFFIPGKKGGYIISYKDNKLEMKKAVNDVSTNRALFLDDYLYVVGHDKIVVFDENNWNGVKVFNYNDISF